MTGLPFRRGASKRGCVLLAVAVLGAGVEEGSAQPVRHATGQEVVPAYEGWERNPDGSFNLLFGTMNRNWEEELDIPTGPANNIEPGGPDQGQPTHFLPRRNRFLVRIRVPSDFGDRELIWTPHESERPDEKGLRDAPPRLLHRRHHPATEQRSAHQGMAPHQQGPRARGRRQDDQNGPRGATADVDGRCHR